MKRINYLCARRTNYYIFLLLFLLQTVFLSSCGKKHSVAPKKKEETKIDYFAGNTSVRINKIEYTLIDDYIKWVPVLYQKKDFNEIEKHIYGLLRDNNEAKSYELYILYHILAKITDNKHIDLMQSVLNEWCNKHAGSHIPWLVRGVFYIDYAWTIRGGGLAKSVPKKAWTKFYEKLQLAQKDLEKSWKLNPKDPNSSCNLLVVARGLKYPRERMEQYYENGISACPWHFGVRFKKLQYLKPKWHGSSEEMFEFAKQCLMSSEQYPYLGLIMVNALEEMHKYNPKKENILGKDDNWPTIEKIYAAFFTKYPEDIVRRFYYAYHAYKAKKYAVALDQFEIIGNRWMEDTCWYSLGYYNDSRAFAYYKIGEDLLWKKHLYEISIDYFQSAIKYNPTANAYYGLGIAYWYTGNSTRNVSLLKKAEESLAKAVQLKPDHKLAKEQLKKLRKYLRRH